MKKLIELDAALDALADYIHNVNRVYSTGKLTHDDCMDAAHSILDGLPSAQRWIPVAERLPENDNDVLVTDGTDCAVAYWRTDAQAWDDCLHGWCDLYGLNVVAWMPLPAAYQEGGKE